VQAPKPIFLAVQLLTDVRLHPCQAKTRKTAVLGTKGNYSPIHLFIRTGRFFGFHAERRFILYIKIYFIYNIKHLQIKNQLFFKYIPVRLNK